MYFSDAIALHPFVNSSVESSKVSLSKRGYVNKKVCLCVCVCGGVILWVELKLTNVITTKQTLPHG